MKSETLEMTAQNPINSPLTTHFWVVVLPGRSA
jgi:hypothetical protein